MTRTVTVVVVLALAACVSAKKLVNEKLSVHASMNYSMEKHYDHEPVQKVTPGIPDVKNDSDVSKLEEMLKSLNPELYNYLSNIFSKASTDSVKQTTLNPLEYGPSKHEDESTTSGYSSEYVNHHITKTLPHEPTEATRTVNIKPSRIIHHPKSSTYPSITTKEYTDSASLSQDGSGNLYWNSKLVPFVTEEQLHVTPQDDAYETTDVYTDSIETSTMQTLEYESKLIEENQKIAVLDSGNLARPVLHNYNVSTQYPTINSERLTERNGTTTMLPEYTQEFHDFNSKESRNEPTDVVNKTSKDDSQYSTSSPMENIDSYKSSPTLYPSEAGSEHKKLDWGSVRTGDNDGYFNTSKFDIDEVTENPASTTLLPQTFDWNSTIFGISSEEVEYSTTRDDIHEATRVPDNMLKILTDSVTHVSEFEPTGTVSSPQDVVFHEEDTNTDLLSTFSKVDARTSEEDMSSEIKENNDSSTKRFTHITDSLTETTTESVFGETTLSDEENTTVEENRSNDVTQWVENSTYITMDYSSLQETTFSGDDIEDSKPTISSMTPPHSTSDGPENAASPEVQTPTDGDTNHTIVGLFHNTPAPQDGEERQPDRSSLNSIQYIVRDCYGISRVIPVVTDPEVVTKSLNETDQVTGLPFSDSKGHMDESYRAKTTTSQSSSDGQSVPKTKSPSAQDFDSLQKVLRPKAPQRDEGGPEFMDNFKPFDQNILEDVGNSSTTPSIKQDHKPNKDTLDNVNQNKVDPFSISNISTSEAPLNLVGTNISKRVRSGELPFVVSLQEKSGYHFCCGTILTSSWILTAAHCFRPLKRRDAANLQVMVGSHRLPGNENDTQILEVAYIIWHESFLIDDGTHFKDDIAVLKLTSEMEFNDAVGISVLSMDRDWSQEHEVVLGFSSYYNSELLQIKLMSPLERECRSHLGEAYFSSFVCIKDPLQCLVEEDSGAPVIVDGLQTGVAAFPNKKMTGFLRVSSYFSWIQNKTDYVWPTFSPVGRVAEKGEFPFVVILRIKDSEDHCTGIILNPEWVLAPGQCFRHVNDISKYELLAGLTRLIDAYAVTRNISAIKWYEEEDSNINQDFVLLQLEQKLTFQRAVQPSRLAEPRDEIHFTEPIEAIGWQNLFVGDCITQHLHHVSLSLLTREHCVNKLGNDTNITMCVDPRKPLLKGIMGSVVVQKGVVIGVSGEDQSQFTLIQPLLKWIASSVF